MDKQYLKIGALPASLAALLLAWSAAGNAQVAVDKSGNAIGAPSEEIPLLSAAELEELVGPIALYPDDLLAIVLPASTFPLQLVQAERFLQDLKNDSSLKPDDDWDDSVVALLNYPEALELLTDELDQTWRLGEAVVAQQADVIAAVEAFRDRAYAAGNLQSDEHQNVVQNDGIIEITPVEDDVIYVPYYEPARVVVYQPRPVYYYYPRPYPVYYYPYPYGYSFQSGFFWGVTTAFTVGWFTDSLHVYHHSYYGHPYYGYSYWNRYWYRRPSIHVYNNYYYGGHSGDYRHHGDYWRPHAGSTVSSRDHRVTRSRQYPGSAVGSTGNTLASTRYASTANRSQVRFRERDGIKPTQARPSTARTTSSSQTNFAPQRSNSNNTRGSSAAIKFRDRDRSVQPRTVEPSRSAPAPRSTQPSHSLQAQRSSQPSRTIQSQRSSQPSRPVQSQRSSQPSRTFQAQRSTQPTRSSQAPRSAQPSHSVQAPRSAQPSRSVQAPRSGQPSRSVQASASRQSGSGSGKVASAGRHSNSKGKDRH